MVGLDGGSQGLWRGSRIGGGGGGSRRVRRVESAGVTETPRMNRMTLGYEPRGVMEDGDKSPGDRNFAANKTVAAANRGGTKNNASPDYRTLAFEALPGNR